MKAKSIVLTTVGAGLAGVALGAILGYVEARPWTWRPGEVAAEDASGVASTAPLDPLLVVDEPIYKFDAMEVGTSQQHAFQLANQGDRPVTVTFASITCQCTGLQLGGKKVDEGDARNIAPGETLEAVLQWEAKGAPRPFRHGATLTSNDPANSRIELTVEGEIVASSTLEPSQFLFGEVPVGETKSASVRVLSRVDSAVDIRSYQVEGPELAESITVDVEPLDAQTLAEKKARSGVAIVATLDPQKSLGPLMGRLRARTNLENAEELSIPITGNVTGDISIYGAGWLSRTGLLKLGLIESEEGKTVRLVVAVRGDHATETKIAVASIDPAELQATLGEPTPLTEDLVHIPLYVEAPPGIRPMVRMDVPDSDSPAAELESSSRGEGILILATTHPETPQVKLRISMTVVP